MNKLSVTEICSMLEKQGMGQYAQDFHRKKVDGAALCKMERAHLIKLGVMNPAHQAALLQRIELYREDSKAGGFSGFGGFLHSAKAKVLAAASQCMASTQKGVAGCASLPQRGVVGCASRWEGVFSGAGGGGGGSDSGVKAKVLEAVAQCMETTQDGFAA